MANEASISLPSPTYRRPHVYNYIFILLHPSLTVTLHFDGWSKGCAFFKCYILTIVHRVVWHDFGLRCLSNTSAGSPISPVLCGISPSCCSGLFLCSCYIRARSSSYLDSSPSLLVCCDSVYADALLLSWPIYFLGKGRRNGAGWQKKAYVSSGVNTWCH